MSTQEPPDQPFTCLASSIPPNPLFFLFADAGVSGARATPGRRPISKADLKKSAKARLALATGQVEDDMDKRRKERDLRTLYVRFKTAADKLPKGEESIRGIHPDVQQVSSTFVNMSKKKFSHKSSFHFRFGFSATAKSRTSRGSSSASWSSPARRLASPPTTPFSPPPSPGASSTSTSSVPRPGTRSRSPSRPPPRSGCPSTPPGYSSPGCPSPSPETQTKSER